MDFVAEIRKSVEQRLTMHRDRTRSDESWMNNSTSSEPQSSRYDEVQVYLLLQILDRLTSIDDSLTAMSSDSWNDHHNK